MSQQHVLFNGLRRTYFPLRGIPQVNRIHFVGLCETGQLLFARELPL